MTDQGKVMIRQEIPLEDGGLVTNAATNLADMKALQGAVKQGDDVYFRSLVTDRLEVTGGFVVDGSSVTIGDGVISARNLVQTDLIITNSLQIGNSTITADHIYLPNGTIDALTANLGTITAGTLIVGAGGVTIKSSVSATTGIFIDGNQIYCKAGDPAAVTVMIDGTTGIISANDFQFLIDSTGTTFDSTSGISIGNLGTNSPADAERIDFKDVNGDIMAELYLNTYTTPPIFIMTTTDWQSAGGVGLQLMGRFITAWASEGVVLGCPGGELGTEVHQLWDTRGEANMPMVDYGTAAVTTGTSQTALAVTWTRDSWAVAPTVAVASCSNKFINCATPGALTKTGCAVDWATIDGSSQSGTVTVVGYWL